MSIILSCDTPYINYCNMYYFILSPEVSFRWLVDNMDSYHVTSVVLVWLQ